MKPVPWVEGLRPAVHGAFHARGDRSDVLDFSANGNVIGPPPGLARALAAVDVSRYPDPDALELREAIAKREGARVDSVTVGNGSSELIWSVARAYLAPGDLALICGPTYGEYAVASAATGAEVRAMRVIETRWFFASVLDGARAQQPKVLWLCHPNNPTGAPFLVERLAELGEACPSTLIVVDEAYLSLCPGLPSAVDFIGTGRVVVLRSMTKDMALAGLRIGALIGAPEVVDVVRRVLPPWNVSSLAQAAGIVACADRLHLARARAAVAESRAHLVMGLQALGLEPWPSVANFVLVPVGDAAGVTATLLEEGCAVRDCTSFGLPDCIRIGVRSIADQEVLLAALSRVLERPGRPPLPLGEGWGEGVPPARTLGIDVSERGTPSPPPLPEGEGLSSSSSPATADTDLDP